MIIFILCLVQIYLFEDFFFKIKIKLSKLYHSTRYELPYEKLDE